jgi:hypothetical protein
MPKMLKREPLPEEETGRAMWIKGRNSETYITLETRSQDDQELSQWYSRRPTQHIISCCSIQYEEVDEIKTTGNIEFNFSLDLPETYFGPGKYPRLTD